LFFVFSFAFLPVVFVNAETLPCNDDTVGKVLCAGAKGPDVGALQQKLKADFASSLVVDCDYGTDTTAKVLAYQVGNHLVSQDGKAGPETMGKLGLKTSGLVSTGPTGPNCMSGSGGSCDPDTNDGCTATQYCTSLAKCAALKGPGEICEGDYACISHHCPTPQNKCDGGGTATCTPACNPDTQTCTNGACVAKTTTPPPASGSCGDPSLEYLNGLCLPKSNFGGLAGTRTWQELTKKIIDILLTIAGVIAVLFILIGGYWYITSAGNEEQAEKGKKALVNAIIGLVVVILSYVIVNVLANLLITKPPA